MNMTPVRLLLIWLLCMIAGTLAPFNFSGGAVPTDNLFKYGVYQQQGLDFVLNLLLFMPLGILAHREGRTRSTRPLLLVVFVGVMALIMSAGVEFLQAYLPSRDSSLIDVFANTAGALIGIALTPIAGALAQSDIRRQSSRTL